MAYFISKLLQTFASLDAARCASVFGPLAAFLNRLVTIPQRALRARVGRRMEYYRKMFDIRV